MDLVTDGCTFEASLPEVISNQSVSSRGSKTNTVSEGSSQLIVALNGDIK